MTVQTTAQLLVLGLWLFQTPRVGEVRGIVLDGMSSEPLVGVAITLSGRETRTAKDGKFVLEGVPLGSAMLFAFKDGYGLGRPPSYRLSVPEGVPITVTKGVVAELVLHMDRTGALSGRVVDSEGRPVRSASLRVYRYLPSETGIELGEADPRGIQIRGGESNDRGDFRIYNLEAGRYALYVQPRPPLLPMYFPSAVRAAAAQPLVVSAGKELSLGTLVLPTPAIAVSRIHLTNRTGDRALRVLVTVRRQGEPNPVLRTNVTMADEVTSDLGKLPPDVYEVEALAELMSSTGSSPSFAVARTTANIVTNAQIDLVLTGNALLTGQVSVLSSETERGESGIVVGLTSIEPLSDLKVSMVTDTNGRFSAASVPPGLFRISVPVMDETCLQGIFSGDRDVLRDGLLVQNDPVSVRILLETAENTVSGRVVDLNKLPVHGAFVVLAPTSGPEAAKPPIVVRADQSGNFSAHCVKLGAYRLLSLRELDAHVHLNQDFLKGYDGRGLAIQITTPGQTNLGDVSIEE